MIFLSLILFGSPVEKKECTCIPAAKTDNFYPGNESVMIEGTRTIRRLQGVVLDPADQVMPQSLVEVFSSNTSLMNRDVQNVSSGREQQSRIKVCWTDEKGRFCFRGIQIGIYIMRISHQGFQPVSFIVEIKAGKKRQMKPLEVMLNVAT